MVGSESEKSGNLYGCTTVLRIATCGCHDLSVIDHIADDGAVCLGERHSHNRHGHPLVVTSVSVELHGCIIGDIADLGIPHHSGDHTAISRCCRLYFKRAALVDDEVLDNCTCAKTSEKTPCTACGCIVAYHLEVLDRMALSVEVTGEHVSGNERKRVACPAECRCSDRSP